MSASVADGCSSRKVTGEVLASCPALRATASSRSIVRSGGSSSGSDGAFPTVLLNGSISGPVGPSNSTGFFWELVSAPASSSLPAMLRQTTLHAGSPVLDRVRDVLTPLSLQAGALLSAYSPATAFQPDAEGNYTARLTITDGCGIATSLVTVQAVCWPPWALCGRPRRNLSSISTAR